MRSFNCDMYRPLLKICISWGSLPMLLGLACHLSSACCFKCRMLYAWAQRSPAFLLPCIFGDMVGSSPRHILFGLSQSFQCLVLHVCPGILNNGWMEPGNPQRDVDFVEIFSGKGHLTAQLKLAPCMILACFFFFQNLNFGKELL